ncbi:hypothetical protein AWJ20_1300 [Sugiyamaella lignohabitans]|uniref:ZW10 C-terminal helical domain-containing protein n=1 Tax=Sugiyamaella lignohabitans TaxID=796027 RepID=A0A167DKS2_9ASCO|nr:uncharacterized protein AWJ20_1300 [Sugiyamaella lignohabitans]ANB13022.1 hypothetical protein AWJ20_1300 [Sugiyamaella lignohabitans]
MTHPVIELLESEVLSPESSAKKKDQPYFFELENDTEWASGIFCQAGLDEISRGLDKTIETFIDELVSLTESTSPIELVVQSEREASLAREIDENFTHAKAVNDLWILRSGVQEVDVLVELGELAQALSSLDTLRSRLDVFGKTYPGSILEIDIKSHIESIAKTIKDRLENGWTNAIVFGTDDKSNSLTVKQTIQDDLTLQSVYEALQVLDTKDKVGLKSNRVDYLLRTIERNIIDPILSLKVSSANVIEDKLELALENSDKKPDVNAILEALTTAVKFLQDSFDPPLLSVVIAKRFASIIIRKLTSSTLPGLFPETSKGLSLFKKQLGIVIDFETFLNQIKWISPSTRDLSNWVDDFTNEWVIYRKTTYFDELRLAVFSGIELEGYSAREGATGTEVSKTRDKKELKASDSNDEWNWNDEEDHNNEDDKSQPSEKGNSYNDDQAEEDSWGWGEEGDEGDVKQKTFDIPQSRDDSQALETSQEQLTFLTKMTISTNVNAIARIIEKFAAEVMDQTTSLTNHVSDIVDLYQSLLPLIYNTSVPSPLIISYNDLVALATEAETGSIPHVSEKTTEQLKQLANAQLTKVLEESQSKILSYLTKANRFEDCTGENLESSELAIAGVMGFMRNRAEEWKQYTSYPVTVQLLGSVLETAVAAIIEAIESHQDISEEESVQLSNIITTITTLEEIFDNPQVERKEGQSFAAFYVPSWIKFQYLNEILQSKLADITYMHSNGALVDFSSSELTRLIKALFVDSEYRRRAIDEVSGL